MMLGDFNPLDMAYYNEPGNQTVSRCREEIKVSRKNIVAAMRRGQPPDPDVIALLNIDASLSEKCSIIDIKTILKDNCKNSDSLFEVLQAFGLLIRYGLNLLKPESQRPKYWRAVKFSNGAFKDKVDNVMGTRAILSEYGYEVPLNDGIAFPTGVEPNPLSVALVICDLLICKQEILLYSQGEHPHPRHLETLIHKRARVFHPDKTLFEPIIQSSVQLQTQRSHDAASPNSNRSQFDWIVPMAERKSDDPSPFIKSDTTFKNTDMKHPAPVGGIPLPGLVDRVKNFFVKPDSIPVRNAPPPIPPRLTSPADSKKAVPQKMPEPIPTTPSVAENFEYCTMCGTDTATKRCTECGNSRCDICDEQWHNHFVRRGHIRIDLFPPLTVHDAITVIPSIRLNLEDSQENSLAFQSTGYLQNPQSKLPMRNLEENHSGPKATPPPPPVKVSEMEKHNFMKHLTRCFVLLCENTTEYGDYEQLLDQLVQDPSYQDNPEYTKMTRLKDDCKRRIYKLMESFEKMKNDFQSRMEIDKEADDSTYVNIHFSRDEKMPYAQKKQEFDRLVNDNAFSTELMPTLCKLLDYTKDVVKNAIAQELRIHLQEVNRRIDEVTDSDEAELRGLRRKKDRFEAELKTISAKKKRSFAARFFSRDESGSSDEYYDAKEDFQNSPKPKPNRSLPNEKVATPNLQTNDKPPSKSAPQFVRTNNISLDSKKTFHTTADRNSVANDCEVTDGITHDEPPIAVAEDFVWECVYCTFHNSSSSNTCDMCMKTSPNPRLVKQPKPSPELHHQKRQPKIPLKLEIPKQNEPENKAAQQLPTPFSAGKQKFQYMEKRRQEEEIYRQGKELVQCLRNFEVNSNLTIYEIETLLACVADDVSPIEIRTEIWEQMLELQMHRVNSVKHNLGTFTKNEIRDYLIKTKNADESVQMCLEERGKLIDMMKGLFNHITAENIIHAIEESCGDEDRLLETLSGQCLQPLDTYIWGLDESSAPIIEQAQFIEFIFDKQQQVERRTRAILIESDLKSWGRAGLVVKIIDDHADELCENVELSDIIDAVRNCGDVNRSLDYLSQDCELCYSACPMNKIRSLSCCDCKICASCMRQNFELKIKEASIRVNKLMCPVCESPGMNDKTTVENYFMMLDLLLQNLLPIDLHRKFQDRLTEWNLMNDPNFRWCSHCVTGFLYVHPQQLKMTCPECRKHTCFECKKPWEDAHDGITCEAFSEWKLLNDPKTQGIGLAKYLAENGIDCPNCKFRYALAKGGCMHFKCQNPSKMCGLEFCCGCNKSFARSQACTFGKERCKNLGMHCHHPRDCLFYLRDMEIVKLQELLTNNDVAFERDEVEAAADADKVITCPVMEQHEVNVQGEIQLKDEPCGKDIQDAGLCMVHYKEYLVSLINKKNLDPVDIMAKDEMLTIVKRHYKQELLELEGETHAEFMDRLKRYITTEIPLERRKN
ncbi:uncharacterized protein LOC141901185 [Tubulanus polymorphus]|uniref:uncharacterized protein LOC141901185 n=1 Tax=Tubulanus polymorphus TaxID=672921 RepID=UPI003DA649A1